VFGGTAVAGDREAAIFRGVDKVNAEGELADL
jgi:hypothetical protein